MYLRAHTILKRSYSNNIFLLSFCKVVMFLLCLLVEKLLNAIWIDVKQKDILLLFYCKYLYL